MMRYPALRCITLFLSIFFANTTLSDSTLCATLSSRLQNRTFFPNDNTYKTSILSYFFQQERLSPSCIFKPTSARDISFIINASAKFRGTGDQLAVRSGGHAPLPRAANIDGGVTIDLRQMGGITIDNSSVSVGSGAIWKDIYNKVQTMNLTVLGARVAGLGVGGFLTGGGISFFSPEKGFACDHIINMEVVLANGSIVNANAQSNSDLFMALKGGSNNFGIITRFDLQTYTYTDIWGGFVFYPGSTIPQQITAFEKFMDPRSPDPYAEMICAIGYEAVTSSFLVSNGIHYTKPVANPPILQPFTTIEPQLGNTMRITNISDLVAEEEAQQATNSRALWANTVFSPNTQIIEKVHSLWNSTVDSIKSVEGIQYFIIFQKIPAQVAGNSLGLSGRDPLVLCLLSITWNDAEDDNRVNRVTETLINDIEKVTKAAGVFNKYKYLNYAASFQDPIASYGNQSVETLRQVSAKYDPQGFFQTKVPGGFKLVNSPGGPSNSRSSLTSVSLM